VATILVQEGTLKTDDVCIFSKGAVLLHAPLRSSSFYPQPRTAVPPRLECRDQPGAALRAFGMIRDSGDDRPALPVAAVHAAEHDIIGFKATFHRRDHGMVGGRRRHFIGDVSSPSAPIDAERAYDNGNLLAAHQCNDACCRIDVHVLGKQFPVRFLLHDRAIKKLQQAPDRDLLEISIRIRIAHELLCHLHQLPLKERRPFECKAQDALHMGRVKGAEHVADVGCPDMGGQAEQDPVGIQLDTDRCSRTLRDERREAPCPALRSP